MKSDEMQIRALCDNLAQGIRARNLDQVMASYAADVIQYDVLSPMAQHGASEVRKTTKAWLDSWEGAIACELRDLTIETGGDIAFTRSFNHVAGHTKDGRSIDMFTRWTACWRKTNGAWKVVHEHISVPIDPKTMTAALDLQP